LVTADFDTTRIRVKPTALDDNLVGDEAGKLIEVKLEVFEMSRIYSLNAGS
jgi:hypothetical protein